MVHIYICLGFSFFSNKKILAVFFSFKCTDTTNILINFYFMFYATVNGSFVFNLFKLVLANIEKYNRFLYIYLNS